MQLVLTEDQELLAKTAADFVAQKSPIARMRELRDQRDAVGFSKTLWKEMAELGWVGVPFPEAVGGADMGMAELAVVLEALGRKLAPEPFISSVLLAGQTLVLGGSEAQREQWLPGLVEGETCLALAYQEPGSRYDPFKIACAAESSGDGFVLRGAKVHVLDAQAADAIIVAARTSGASGDAAGITLFMVPRDAAGLTATAQVRVDSRGAADLELAGVSLDGSAVIGGVDEGGVLLAQAIERATVGLCAEMLGGMSEAFDLTLTYLKERQQFGALIGSFQGLKHRAARCFMEIELCRSAVMAASRAIDEEDAEASKLVSLAKARCSDAYIQIANEGVQMFGGVGMTDEYDIGLYLKRARAAELTFGDAAFHRDRWARLGNY